MLYKKFKCERYFEEKSNSLDIDGLIKLIPKNLQAQLKISNKKSLKIDSNYALASKYIKEFDELQFSICQDISNITSKEKRNELLSKSVDAKIKMLLVAQNPRSSIVIAEKNKDELLNDDSMSNNIENYYSSLKALMISNKNIGKVIDSLLENFQNEKTLIMIKGDYLQISEDIESDLDNYNNQPWKKLKSRLISFIERKEQESVV